MRTTTDNEKQRAKLFPFEKYGAFFAFSHEQFEKQKEKNTKYKYVGAGLLVPEKNHDKMMEKLDEFYV